MTRRSAILAGAGALGALIMAGTFTVQAQNPAPQAPVELVLSAEKKLTESDTRGRVRVTWQAAGDRFAAAPGDVLRYTVTGINRGDRPVDKLEVSQPIPKGTEYILESVGGDSRRKAAVVYSIDGAHSYVEKPTIQVTLPSGKVETRPAPADAYTHIRWSLAKALASESQVKLTYQVRVR